LAGLKEFKDDLSQKDETEARGTFRNHRSTRTGDLQAKTPGLMEDTQRLSCHFAEKLQGNEIYGENFTESPPELIDGEEVYDVETFLNHRKRGRGYKYYIKWRGYPISDASWEPEHTFSDDGGTLTHYKEQHNL
jgi:hypothetical protein